MIKIGFSTSEKLLSRIIRWITGSQVSHCFLVFDFLGRELVLEAGFTGVTVKPFDEYSKHIKLIKTVELPEFDTGSLSHVIGWLGMGYDFGGMIGASWVLLWRIFKKKVKNPTQSNKALFCSELTVNYLKSINYPGAEELDASSTTPQDLMEFFSSQGR